MSKLERLNARVSKLLTEAVQEVLDVVKETVSEYQQKTARTQRENESLKRRLRELQERIPKDNTAVLPTAEPSAGRTDDAARQNHDSRPFQRHNPSVPYTQQRLIIGHKRNHEVKQESNEQKQLNDGQSGIEHDKAQAEMATKRSEDAESVHAALSTNRDTGAVSLNTVCTTYPSSLLSLSAIKRESEQKECTTSEQPSTQEQYTGRVDLGSSSNPHISAETHRLRVGAEPYGLVFVGADPALRRRQGCAKASGNAFSQRRVVTEQPKRDDVHLCVVCGKTFSRVNNLRIHQHCHTGEKRYGCVQCGRRFRLAGDLNKHKRVHTGEKPYNCSQCGKNFSRGENLKRHQRVHIGKMLQLQRAAVGFSGPN
ncbi:zinc finger and SCAN domain-containing protein 2 [Kryptolebias marmoratus]|uniref:Zinc finger and SCAN domain-containing protein 2-like n=1 Tax=Kryptolebias marmoratus TaxID=37003 RepID=A0A3Q3GZW5_KRYMA|nr:zinc finger and SCAN domain-containing protein 2 [Kryptolebias marmoratus]XP_017290583.1 zinc finger and SCAN domain-containing protein 2 [Kryptolebias marmoratus]